MDIDITQTVLTLWSSGKTKSSPSGWITRNAPCCQHRGHKADKRGRGGFILTNTGGWAMSCFNCNFSTRWEPGSALSAKTKQLLSYLGASDDEISKINFAAFKTKSANPIARVGNKFSIDSLQRHDLPEGAKPFSHWAENPNEEFIKVVKYLNDRNPDLIKWHEYYWTPIAEKPDTDFKMNMNKRVIVPFVNSNTNWMYGFAARSIDNNIEPKYIANYSNGYIFGQEHLFCPHRKYAIVTEGIFDAISISGCAGMKQTLSKNQVDTLHTSEKEIIIVPDRDKDGYKIVEQALDEGFTVAFPEWEKGIKDAADAVAKFGRPAVIRQIIESGERNPIKIKIKMKSWFEGK